MKLKEYLQTNNKTQMSFIKDIQDQKGVTIPQGTLAKWINGQRIPRSTEMLLLFEVTKEKVQPNDFYL
tara:strand:+ start:485 stop:688 length:204 start_codon:yes stop_codon:yes gene_type:complete